MSKGKVQVSNDFAKFYGKNQSAIEEAKKAENSMSSGPAPVGWEGHCILLEAAAEQGKDKKDQNGNTVPGNPRIKMKFGITDDPKYSGKSFTKYWVFNDTANMDAMGRFQMFLNDCEAMGLPRSIREEHESMNELLNFFVEAETVFEVKCITDNYSQDKKKMVVTAPQEAIDDTDSMVPTTTTQPSPEIEVGSEVTFLGNTWKVVEKNGDTLNIEREDGDRIRSKEVRVSAVKPA